MLKILSSHSKQFQSGFLSYSEAGKSHLYKFSHQPPEENQEILIIPVEYHQEYNHGSVWAAYKGSLGALTIAAQLLQKSQMNEQQTTALLSILDNLEELSKLNKDIGIDKHTDQTRKIYELGHILKKNYHHLVIIEQLRQVFENEPFTGKQTEYLEYFSDSYETSIENFQKVNKLCNRYDQTSTNLMFMILHSRDLLGNNLVIDKGCDLQIVDSIKLMEELNIPEENKDQIFLVYVVDNYLIIQGTESNEPFEKKIKLELSK